MSTVDTLVGQWDGLLDIGLPKTISVQVRFYDVKFNVYSI